LKDSEQENIILSFDLDFTLLDNSQGIINSFEYALEKYDLPSVDKNGIRKKIGKPLEEMFKEVAPDFPKNKLVSSFRDYYKKKGIYQVKLLPGVKNKIKDLSHSFLLGIITSKKEEMAKDLIRHLNLSHFFDYILGETKERLRKTDPSIKRFLEANYPSFRYIVIGDHPNDKKLAHMLKSPFIGVLTGNYKKETLERNIKVPYKILRSVKYLNRDLIYQLVE
jgi:phosphoglycolate phosphatase